MDQPPFPALSGMPDDVRRAREIRVEALELLHSLPSGTISPEGHNEVVLAWQYITRATIWLRFGSRSAVIDHERMLDEEGFFLGLDGVVRVLGDDGIARPAERPPVE